MNEGKRRILRCWHDHDGGVSLYVTRHDSGEGLVYRLENRYGIQGSWGDETKAKEKASEFLKEAGHHCSENCSDWGPISN